MSKKYLVVADSISAHDKLVKLYGVPREECCFASEEQLPLYHDTKLTILRLDPTGEYKLLNFDRPENKFQRWSRIHIAWRVGIFIACVLVPSLIFIIIVMAITGEEAPPVNPWTTAPLFFGIVKSIYSKKYSHWITGGLVLMMLLHLLLINYLMNNPY
ncbi:MAG: hypothetical protein ABIE14_03395 [Patescibacteria group bacterium]